MCGDFAWLGVTPPHDPNIGQERSENNAEAMQLLRESCLKLGLRLPIPFSRFMESSALQARVRSNTDCFLDLSREPVSSPLGGGYLIRFLADSQGCVFWYLYLTNDSSDHAVVSSPGFYGTQAEQWQDEPPDPATIGFSAESFETFIARFWLENEAWFSANDRTPMPEVCRDYINRYANKSA
jgi:hypothetical protein